MGLLRQKGLDVGTEFSTDQLVAMVRSVQSNIGETTRAQLGPTKFTELAHRMSAATRGAISRLDARNQGGRDGDAASFARCGRRKIRLIRSGSFARLAVAT